MDVCSTLVIKKCGCFYFFLNHILITLFLISEGLVNCKTKRLCTRILLLCPFKKGQTISDNDNRDNYVYRKLNYNVQIILD